VLVFGLVLIAVLACLRSTWWSSSPPDEANESCGLKYWPDDCGSRLLRRLDPSALSVDAEDLTGSATSAFSGSIWCFLDSADCLATAVGA
jgi:hypothetical protein